MCTAPEAGLTTRQLRGLAALGLLLFAFYASVIPLDFQAIPLGRAVARLAASRHVPFARVPRSDFAANLALYLPIGALLAGTLSRPASRFRSRVALVAAIGAGTAMCAALSELAQAFVRTRTPSVYDIAAQLLGGIAGAGAWLIGQPVAARLQLGERVCAGVASAARPGSCRPSSAAPLVAWVALSAAAYLWPYEFHSDAESVAERARSFVAVPFLALYEGPPADAALHIAAMLVLTIPLGALLERTRPARPHGSRSPDGRLLTVAAVALTLLELGQAFVPSRRCDATDVLLGMVGTVAGLLAVARVKKM
jgi:VanZ family protein